jgi:hypothetical protein
MRNRDAASVTIPECCWLLREDTEDLLLFGQVRASGTESPVVVGIANISVVYLGGCPSDPTRLLGVHPHDLIDWVQSAPQLDASEPRSIVALGRSGIALEATVLAPAGTCTQDVAWLMGVAATSWEMPVGTHILFEALDDGSRTITVVYAGSNAGALAYAEGVGKALIDSIVLRD